MLYTYSLRERGKSILIRVVLLNNYLLLRFKEKKRIERIAYLLIRKQNRKKVVEEIILSELTKRVTEYIKK